MSSPRIAFSILEWLHKDAEPSNLYELLGEPLFSPDHQAIRSAVRAAHREIFDYQNHPDHELVQRALILQKHLGLAQDCLDLPARLAEHDEELIGRLRSEWMARGEPADPAALREWLVNQRHVHAASVERVAARLQPPHRNGTAASVHLDANTPARLEPEVRPAEPEPQPDTPAPPPPRARGGLIRGFQWLLYWQLPDWRHELELEWWSWYVEGLGEPWPFERDEPRCCLRCGTLRRTRKPACHLCGGPTVGTSLVGVATGLDARFQKSAATVERAMARCLSLLVWLVVVPSIAAFALASMLVGPLAGLLFLVPVAAMGGAFFLDQRRALALAALDRIEDDPLPDPIATGQTVEVLEAVFERFLDGWSVGLDFSYKELRLALANRNVPPTTTLVEHVAAVFQLRVAAKLPHVLHLFVVRDLDSTPGAEDAIIPIHRRSEVVIAARFQPALNPPANLSGRRSLQSSGIVFLPQTPSGTETPEKEAVPVCGARTASGGICRRRVRGGGRCFQHRI